MYFLWYRLNFTPLYVKITLSCFKARKNEKNFCKLTIKEEINGWKQNIFVKLFRKYFPFFKKVWKAAKTLKLKWKTPFSLRYPAGSAGLPPDLPPERTSRQRYHRKRYRPQGSAGWPAGCRSDEGLFPVPAEGAVPGSDRLFLNRKSKAFRWYSQLSVGL